jgi:SAM-dependent methyltransferase
MGEQHSQKAALRGEPSYVWRAGQERRLSMILDAAAQRAFGRVLENGCGVGAYLKRLSDTASLAAGLEVEFERAQEARALGLRTLCAVGEQLPFPSQEFDLVLSHEVLEHVHDDQQVIREIVRVLKPGGRLILFCPNRGYPFETHGIYWRGRYHFGNIALVNYLPRAWRDRLAPHVNVYSTRDLRRLFQGLPVRVVTSTVIFGAYDNIIARQPVLGKALRSVLQLLEKTPFKHLGLSHFWVVEKTT